jgi:uncharacterized ion transporter superfamily protein YfcC
MNRRLLLFLGFLIFALLVVFLSKFNLGFFDTIALFLAIGIVVGLLSRLLKR